MSKKIIATSSLTLSLSGHVITALQSTVGMSVWLYVIAVILSMPKGFAFVYLGVALGRVHGDATPEQLQVSHLDASTAQY